MKTAPLTDLETPTHPGRPSGYCPDVVALLCAIIRQRGVSDSAAAEEAGCSSSAISRWKQQFPELRIILRQARAQFRQAHLENILEASRAEGSRGWRASAWLLERIFPEDYSPKAAEREKFQDLAEFRQDCEEHPETPSHNSRNTPAAPEPTDLFLPLTSENPSRISRNPSEPPARIQPVEQTHAVPEVALAAQTAW